MNKQVLLTRKQDHLPTPHPWYQHEGSSLVMTRVQSGRKEASSEKDQWRCIRCSLIYPGGMAQRHRGTEAQRLSPRCSCEVVAVTHQPRGDSSQVVSLKGCPPLSHSKMQSS